MDIWWEIRQYESRELDFWWCRNSSRLGPWLVTPPGFHPVLSWTCPLSLHTPSSSSLSMNPVTYHMYASIIIQFFWIFIIYLFFLKKKSWWFIFITINLATCVSCSNPHNACCWRGWRGEARQNTQIQQLRPRKVIPNRI